MNGYLFPEEHINDVRYENNFLDGDNVPTISEFNKLLRSIDEEFQSSLKALHGAAVRGESIDEWGIRERWVAFSGDIQWRWRDVFDKVGIEDPKTRRVVKDIHSGFAEKMGFEVGDAEVIVTNYPMQWGNGYAAAIREIDHLVECGLSAAEALDLWRTAYGPHGGITPRFWSEKRGVSTQAVEKNVRMGREKIQHGIQKSDLQHPT